MDQFIELVKERLAYIPIEDEVAAQYYICYKEDVPRLLQRIEKTEKQKDKSLQDRVVKIAGSQPVSYVYPDFVLGYCIYVIWEEGYTMLVIIPQEMLFDKLCEEYLQYSRANKAIKTYERDILSIKHLLGLFGQRSVNEISARDVETYKNKRRTVVKPATVNRELSCIKHMFTKAKQWDYVKNNPTQYVAKFKEPPGRVRYLNKKEITKLLQCCSEHLKPIAILALNTGMRKGEILTLKWSNIDMIHRLITIRKTKNNQIKAIPINEVLYSTLRSLQLKAKHEYVFTNLDGQPFGDIKKGFNAAVRRAGIIDFHFHDLRHTFASHLVMNGVDIRTVQELLGHKNILMTMRYSHLSNEHLRKAVAKLGDNPKRKMPGRRIELRTPGFSVRCSTIEFKEIKK